MKNPYTAMIVTCILLSASLTLAGQPYGTNWGKWGPNDQLGAWNYITPEKTAAAAKLVKKGEILMFSRGTSFVSGPAGWWF